jgi:glycosyltransferase involved in cell wall biosynthesis
LLVVDATAPTPDQDAGSVQTFMALQACQGLGYKAHFVPEDNWLFEPKYIPALQRIGVDCAYAPYELGFESYMRRYGWQFDVVMVYRASVMEKALPIIRTYAPQAAVIFHVADLHFLRLRRTAELQKDEEVMAQAALMKERELALIAATDCTVTHSSAEQEILAHEAPESSVVLWPLMFEYYGTTVSFSSRRDLCFLGGYRHPPNIDAVIYFVHEVFPLIKRAEPDIRFIIAGAHVPDELRSLARNDIIVKGMVGDLRDLFDPCRVFVCPLRIGAGAKGKVVSALSYGVPVVSTRVGVEGAGLFDGETVLVADDPEDFAATVLRLYRDQYLWERLSASGQCLIRDKLSRSMGERVLSRAIETAFATKLGLGESVSPAA